MPTFSGGAEPGTRRDLRRILRTSPWCKKFGLVRSAYPRSRKLTYSNGSGPHMPVTPNPESQPQANQPNQTHDWLAGWSLSTLHPVRITVRKPGEADKASPPPPPYIVGRRGPGEARVRTGPQHTRRAHTFGCRTPWQPRPRTSLYTRSHEASSRCPSSEPTEHCSLRWIVLCCMLYCAVLLLSLIHI